MLFLRVFFLVKTRFGEGYSPFDCTIKTEFFFSPDTVGVRFEFIRECINKIRPKLHFLSKIEIKMTHLVVLFCYLLSLCF